MKTLDAPAAASNEISIEAFRHWAPGLVRRDGAVGQAPSELASVPMLSALLRAAFSVSAFLRVECWSRAHGTRAEGPRGSRMARGWGTWTGVPHLIFIKGAKIYRTKKIPRNTEVGAAAEIQKIII